MLWEKEQLLNTTNNPSRIKFSNTETNNSLLSFHLFICVLFLQLSKNIQTPVLNTLRMTPSLNFLHSTGHSSVCLSRLVNPLPHNATFRRTKDI